MDTQQLYASAIELLNSDRLHDALQQLEKAISIDPTDQKLWHLKGIVLYGLGHPMQAIAAFDEAIRQDPRQPRAWQGKANTLQALGHFEQAMEAYTTATQLDPAFSEAWYGKGVNLLRLNRPEEALVAYEEALRHAPGNPRFSYSKGQVLQMLARYPEALAAYEQTLKGEPQFTPAWYGKGTTLAALNQLPEALLALEETIQRDPQAPLPWLAKFDLLQKQGLAAPATSALLRLHQLGGFTEVADAIPTFLFFLTSNPAPYFSRKLFLEFHADPYGWQKLLALTQEACALPDQIIDHRYADRQDQDLDLQDHFLIALTHYYMGDPVAAFDRIEEYILDPTPDHIPSQYYLLQASEAFCEPYQDYLTTFLDQADTWLLTATPDSEPQTAYYTGLLYLHAAEVKHPVPYIQLGTQLQPAPKTFHPATLEKALQCFSLHPHFLPSTYMQALTLKHLGRESEAETHLAALHQQEDLLNAFLSKLANGQAEWQPSETHALLTHFAHSQELREAINLVRPFTPPTFSQLRLPNTILAQERTAQQAQALSEASQELQTLLSDALPDFPYFQTTTDKEDLVSQLILTLQTSQDPSTTIALIQYLAQTHKITPFQALASSLYLEIYLQPQGFVVTPQVIGELTQATLRTHFYCTQHFIPQDYHEAPQFLKALTSPTAQLTALLTRQYLLSKLGASGLPSFPDFKADLLSFAHTLKNHIQADWHPNPFTPELT